MNSICVIRVIRGKTILNSLRLDRPVNSLYLVKHSVYRTFRPDQLRQRDLRECVFHDLMQADDHRPNAAIALVNTRFQNACVTVTMLGQHILIQHPDYFTEAYIFRRPGEKIAAFGSTSRANETGFIEQPHQLARVRGRDTFALGDLRQRQAVTIT